MYVFFYFTITIYVLLFDELFSCNVHVRGNRRETIMWIIRCEHICGQSGSKRSGQERLKVCK